MKALNSLHVPWTYRTPSRPAFVSVCLEIFILAKTVGKAMIIAFLNTLGETSLNLEVISESS